MPETRTLTKLNIASFLQSQIFLFPVLLLFYQHNGLTVGDFFLFQGIYSLTRLLLEVPSGYLGDLFSKKAVLILSYVFFILRCLLLLFFVQYGYWIILVAEILTGSEKAFFSGSIDSYIFEYLEKYGKRGQMPKQYGKLWAFMAVGATISSLTASWLYHIISQYTIARWHTDYGFVSLILIEMIFNIAAISLVWRIPRIKVSEKHKKSLKRVCFNFMGSIGYVFKHNSLKYHILFAAALWGAAGLFAWTFQPMMQTMKFPVAIYGLAYFINQLTRAIFSSKTGAIAKHISLSGMGKLVFGGFISSFIVFVLMAEIQPLPLALNLLYFVFISFVIAGQLVFSNIFTAYMHYIVLPDIRATVSSVYAMIGQLFSGVYLILLKFLIDKFSLSFSMLACLFIFIPLIVPLIIISNQEKNTDFNILRD